MKSFRRSLRVLGLLLFASHAVEIGEAQTPPTRILPLGDSLTSGTSVVGAYRNRLYTLLTGAGFNVDFVGTQADANNPTLPDRDHQGMGGYRIDQIQAGLSSWLNAIADPDVVLLMIGTNDFSGNYNVATAQNRLASLVTDIATKRPFAKIVLASLPLRTDDPNLEALQSAFNASIPGIVSAQVAQGHQVSFLDMHAVLLSGDFVEGVHPTATGYDKMANAWFPAVTSVITPLGTANPPAIAHTEPAVDLQHVAVTFSKPVADTAANIANFSLNGGLSISQAVLDPATKRTITLTTSAQTASTLYTLTVSGVRDRTPAQNLIAAGSTVAYSSFSLLNGSFESGETGWTMTGNYQIYNTAPPYIASDGTKMVILNGGQTPPTGQVSQTFPTVPGQSYVLDFDMGILALNTFEQKVGVEITGTVPLLSVTDSVFGNGLGDSVWAAKSHTFIANSTTTNLTLRDLSPTSNGIDLLLDHVRVTAIAKPANTAPTAVADAYSAIKDIALTVPAGGVLSNDTDPESNVLSAALNAGPSHGSVTLNANGGFTYTPAAGYTGPDSFTYHANDANLNSNIATVTITVSALTPGTLVNGSFESGQSGWTMTGNFLVYANNPPYIAFDGVTMVVMNGGQTPPTGVISQTFPTVPGQTYALDFNVGSVATNSSEQKLGVEIIGSVTLLSVTDSVFGNSQGNSVWTAKSHTFTANSAMSTLTFRDLSPTSDGVDLLLDNVRLTAIASPVNTAPVAVADSYSATQNTALIVSAAGVLLNDTDAESNVLTAVLNAGPSHGSVTLNANGGFTYTSTTGYTGADSFT
ncbi:MAG: Ig-like domain-containing protein, partial [Luteolibacter sp.]